MGTFEEIRLKMIPATTQQYFLQQKAGWGQPAFENTRVI
jgi:hypothetical protein